MLAGLIGLLIVVAIVLFLVKVAIAGGIVLIPCATSRASARSTR